MFLLGTAIAESYLGVAPRLARSDPASLRRLFVKTTWRMLGFGFVCALPLLVAGPQIFDFVLGSQWREAGVYARYWVPAMVLQFAVAPLNETANVLERQASQLLLDGARFAALAGAFAIGVGLDLPADSMVLALSIVTSIAYVGYGVAYYRILRRHERVAS
jgi:O-antigen/teichoic acid export membrane protein